MSEQGKPKSLLSLLGRRFSARIRIADLAAVGLSVDRGDALFKKGVLSACRSDDVDHVPCPLGDHEGDGLVAVQKERDGSYRGLCKEHGRIVRIKAEDAEWVTFDASAWVAAVRAANGLVGDMVVDDTGCCLFGVYQSGTKKIAVGAISSQTPVAAAGHGPGAEGVRMAIFADLGGRVTDAMPGSDRLSIANGADMFQDDLVSFRADAILAALAKAKSVFPAGTHAVKIAGGGKTVPLSLDQYAAEVSAKNLRKYSLAIDLTQSTAWKVGRPIRDMANKGEKGRPKPLSRKGLLQLSYFIRHPNRSINPHRVPPYYDGTVDSRQKESAQVMLLKMRKTLGMDSVIQHTGNPDGKRGTGFYAFRPTAGYKVLLIVPPEEE